ncbi:Ymd8p PWA37_004011 [Arxiozyma heterogenica]|uniref:Ymd8p n=1 Tax=Arxiozyma heterogenica TaxID=278026 RepID=UPI002EEBE005
MNVKVFMLCILGWYSTSITLSVYNKWMFSSNNGLGIEYPILLTAGHQLTLWIFSFIYVLIRGRDEYNKVKTVDWEFYWKFIVPTAIATAGDVVLSNISFKYVPLTVYTIIKSSSIAFVLLFGCLFNLEQFSFQLGLIVIVMFIGVVLMVYTPVTLENNKVTDQTTLIIGAIIVLGSSCLSGLRWVYTQLIVRKRIHTTTTSIKNDSRLNIRLNEFDIDEDLENNSNNNTKVSKLIENKTDFNENMLKKHDEDLIKKPHPIYTVYQVAPIMFLVLLVASLIVERPFPKFFDCNLFKKGLNAEGPTTITSIFYGIILMLIPGICVVVLTLSEFRILQISKVLTVSIASIIKELLTILLGIWILSERISGIYNIFGMIIILLDVCYYNYYKYKEKEKKDKYIPVPLEDTFAGNENIESREELYDSIDNNKMMMNGNKNDNNNNTKNKETDNMNSVNKTEDPFLFDDSDIDNIPFPTGGSITVQEYEMDFLRK